MTVSARQTVSLQELDPKEVWKHFDAIRQIPRASGNENAAREYVLGEARRLGLSSKRDAFGNIVISKPAQKGREGAPTVALQGHLDMVCEKNEGTPHDFSRDPIRVVRDGEWLKADGTTLGADNGLGVAAALAVMESKDIGHGPMEFVFTMEEETGLIGASEFGEGMITAKYFLNLDGEEKGTLCIGCSGGVNTTARRKVTLKAASANAAYRVKVSGLKGGHSGVDIHLGRGNAIRILANAVQRAMEKLPLDLADIKGGSARNVIPREASAVVVLDEARSAELKSIIADFAEETKTDLGKFDPGVQITVEKTDKPAHVLDQGEATRIVDLLASLHHGVLAMSPDIPGLVQTSTNIATVAVNGDQVEVGTSQRSSVESSKMAAARMVGTACRAAGFDVEPGSGYPGWKPEPESEIVRKLKDVYKHTFGDETRLVAMHAGLECGVIGEKYPGMQMVSFGPQIESPHSPNERVEIPSVAEFWKFLTAALERL